MTQRIYFSAAWTMIGMVTVLATLSASAMAAPAAPAAPAAQELPQRPPTEDLLPETTVVFFQIDDVRNFAQKMSESSIGQMLQDESMAPLVGDLWEQAKSAYQENEDEIGVSMEDLQSFPAGEMTFAVIAPRRKDPEFMMILQTDADSDAVDRILERGRELVRDDGKEVETETTAEGLEFESFAADGKTIKFFRHEGLIVGSSSPAELDDLIARWQGLEVEKVRPLSQNRKFITIMNRCRGSQELKPEVRIFVDPISLAKSATRGNVGAQTAINFLPLLGLDGLLGVGGSMLLSEDEFKSIAHGHVLLANPRKGVLEMLAFKPTDYRPEPWMPDNISTYFTTSWDVNQMLAELTKIIESFGVAEGGVDKWIDETISSELEFDAREEILGALTGRVTVVQAFDQPYRLNSQVNVIALELKDPTAAEETVDKILARIQRDVKEDGLDRIEETDHKGVRVFGQSAEVLELRAQRRTDRRQRRADRADDEDGGGPQIDFEASLNPTTPSFALVGNYLVLSPQSRPFLERVIDVDQGDVDSLADSEDYQDTAEKMTGLLGTDMPSGIVFARPVETFRWIYSMAGSDQARAMLAQGSDENQYVGGIKRALDDHELPEFEEMEHYFQPQGGFMTSDDTGYHFLVFELQGEE